MTMKKFMKYTHILIGIVLLFCGCSEDVFLPSDQEGDNVIMSLSYSDVSPKEVVVNTRATDAEERHLDNLYIYIFNANGQLKGFKAITKAEALNQETSSSKHGTINGILTKTGASYIYAVANINTGLYPVTTTTNGIFEEGKLPINLDEEKAQAGQYNITLDQLKSLTFNRNKENTIQISSAFLMSGSIQNGKQVTINKDGSISGNDNAIKLNRIVSKVRVTFKAAKAVKDTIRSFKLSTYDIMNISMDGKLIGKADGNQVNAPSSKGFSNITGTAPGVNDIDNLGRSFFEFYLPENMENAKYNVDNWNAREEDNQTTPKVFTNAPENGTYVVLKGKYEETVKGVSRSADVTYYVHLGDCTADVNDYNVERNCKYTFHVTIAGVDKIIVEAKKEGNEQPGAEGVVMEYGSAGRSIILDSHYDYMVMRFYQDDIKELKKEGKGYYYQVYVLGNNTNPINVGASITGKEEDDKKIDTSWIEFATGNSTYDETGKNMKGTACAYPGLGKTDDIETFLKKLYDHADDANSNNSFWNGTDSKSRKYIDATCFVSENYYKNMNWDKYVNDVPKRAFYVANAVQVSEDGRSVYAITQYGLQQYNIQTFYDRSQADKVIAYGCETINDEEGQKFTDNGGNSRAQYQSNGTDQWNGRANMLKDINTNSFTWKDVASNKSLVKACMSRNRDLNGDGKITEDEIRWYAPAIHQYIGLWIGEEIISTESKLFNKSTDILNVVGNSLEPASGTRMLYYTSTKGVNTYFSEEGLATTNHNDKYPATYIRCIRNLASNDEGYSKDPSKYYSYDEKTKLVKLDKVDNKALNITGDQGELNAHTERSEGNKPASEFYIASNTYGNFTQQKVVEGSAKCNGNYTEGSKTWRVPNQRELSMMFLIDPNYIQQTYCRTKFSNENFRHSWTYDNGIFTMDVGKWNTPGLIRCISVKK